MHNIQHSVARYSPGTRQISLARIPLFLFFFGRAESLSNAVPVGFLSSSSVYVSESDPGTISACAAQVVSALLRFQEIPVNRVVVRASTAFTFSSVSGSDDFVVDVRSSATTNTAEAAAIPTLRT